jgi:hypothetical protein
MNRRRALLGAGASALLPLPVLAQDGTVPEEWEERFAALEERVAAIELRLEELLGEEDAPTEQAAEDQTRSSSGDVIRFSGTGTTLTEVVSMSAGPYRVQALVNVTNGFGDVFSVDVAGSNDWQDSIFIEFFEGNGEQEVSTNWTAKRDGDYAFQVDCMSAWELTFESM